MTLLNIVLAAAPSGSGGQPANPLMNLLPFAFIIVIMYLLMIRPQQKKQKEHRDLLANLQKGDKVVTAGGILGTIAGIKEKEKTLLIKVSDTTKIEVLRSSIAQVLKSKYETGS